jgi:hypothetical protein
MRNPRSPVIAFSEPEARALLSERAQARELEFLAGAIGEATFLRSLMLYGMSREAARHELWKIQQGDNSL